MTGQRVAVVVGKNGDVVATANGIGGGQVRAESPVALGGLDGRLVRMLARWMEKHEDGWSVEDVRAFGQLLHRTLFTDGDIWKYVKEHIEAAGSDVCRILLAFPPDGPASRLAGLPWEYLHTPDAQSGWFLATDPRMVLARSLPLGTLASTGALAEVRILLVVSNPDKERLGMVEAEPVLDKMKAATDRRADLTLLNLREDLTLPALQEAIAADQPDLLHFVGHGEFREGVGQLALIDDGGDYVWVRDSSFAKAVTASTPPQVVVLHSCEVGKSDFDYRFSGLAPELVDRGVGCVVAMQYRVDTKVAESFTGLLYQELSKGHAVDVAVQRAREGLADKYKNPRLLGLPIVYQRRAPLLAASEEVDQ